MPREIDFLGTKVTKFLVYSPKEGIDDPEVFGGLKNDYPYFLL